MPKNIIVGKILTCLSLIVLSFFLSYDACAGAWTVPKHKFWGEYNFKWQWADEEFDAGRNRVDKSQDAHSWEFIMAPKFEFGVTDWFNILGSLEYKESKYKEYDRPTSWGPFRRKNHGISSVTIGGKIRFIEDPVVLSGQVDVSIYPGYGNYNGDDPAFRNQPSIGDGEDSVELRGLIGKEFNIPLGHEDRSVKCYVGAETGYRIKNRDVNNDIPFFLEGGFWPLDWLLLKAEVDGYVSHDSTGNVEKDYAIWRAGAVWQILAGNSVTKQGKTFNIEFQYGQTFWGRNTDAFQELILKVQTQF